MKRSFFVFILKSSLCMYHIFYEIFIWFSFAQKSFVIFHLAHVAFAIFCMSFLSISVILRHHHRHLIVWCLLLSSFDFFSCWEINFGCYSPKSKCIPHTQLNRSYFFFVLNTKNISKKKNEKFIQKWIFAQNNEIKQQKIK